MAALSIWLLLLLLQFLMAIASGSGGVPGLNPLSAKASVLRYWNVHIPNTPKPAFLMEKASPLDALHSSVLRRYAEQSSLALHLPTLCDAAHLFCFPDPSPSLEKHESNVDFTSYSGRNFSNYRSGSTGGIDSFKKYSENANVAANSFTRYSRDSSRHDDSFSSYVPDVNVGDSEFLSYGVAASGGSGQFSSYADNINVPGLRFSTYETDAAGRNRDFRAYSFQGNAGDQSFVSYGRKGKGVPSGFVNYGEGGNVIGSTFSNYGEDGVRANDSFTNYGLNGNGPEDNFRTYGTGGNDGIDTFTNYRDSANVGDDSFTSYGKLGISPKLNFINYGQSANVGTDKFKSYGEGAFKPQVGFKTYGINNTFGNYGDKKSVTFSAYTSPSTASNLSSTKWAVEPGKFFREKMMKAGTVMPMPDLRDRMPPRSFLPRSIAERLPFSSSKLGELKKVFHARENSSMERLMKNTLAECEREPSKGETKRCVTSIEDMIDFATSMLGRDVQLRSTESTMGWGKNVEIGEVKGLDGGRITRSVSCHQSMFPYLVYYCHSVPIVRVYEADILDVKSKKKINHGVAICHLDTSAWGPGNGAFVALGSKPGEIEVCHWIFENDMIWVRAG
ncbi:polygalacturonase 1 beta-like protein 3 [Nymphaea colorata]|nr:polygalacturonase 1 beta-like protein 3 [Nymphaea colorata]